MPVILLECIVFAAVFVVLSSSVVMLRPSSLKTPVGADPDAPRGAVGAIRIQLGLILISVILLGLLFSKLYFVSVGGADIGVEFVGPARTKAVGATIQNALATDKQTDYLFCTVKKRFCEDNTQYRASRLAVSLWDYVHDNAARAKERIAWIMNENMSMTAEASFRGRVIHHYSTILFPYYQARHDGLVSIVGAQYGALSIIPLFFVTSGPFFAYGTYAWGIFFGIAGAIWLIVAGASFNRNRPGLIATLTIGALLILSLNQNAIYISPGFSPVRYFSTFGIIAILLFSPRSNAISIAMAVLACFNSIDFNLLLLILLAMSAAAVYLPAWACAGPVSHDRQMLVFLSRIVLLAVVLGGQMLIIFRAHADFPSSFLASLGDVDQFTFLAKFGYAAALVLLPASSLFLLGRRRLLGNPLIVQAIIYSIGFVQYSGSFYGSPQHYCGFLLTVSPALTYLLLRLFDRSSKRFTVGLVALAITPIIYSHFTWPEATEAGEQMFTAEKIGKPLWFQTGNDVARIANEIQSLTPAKDLASHKLYLLIREKMLLELYFNQAFNPRMNDSFGNSLLLRKDDIGKYLDGIDLVVTYSPRYVTDFASYLDFVQGASIEALEAQKLKVLLKHQLELQQALSQYKSNCSQNYCVYEIAHLGAAMTNSATPTPACCLGSAATAAIRPD